MNLYKEWLDRYGFLHLKPNPEPEATENAPTFTAELMLLQKLNYGTVGEIPAIKKLRLASGELRTTPVSTFGGHVSHDTVTGLYCIRELSGIKNFPLPTFKWNNRFWAHPRDHIFYGAMNGNPIALLLLHLLQQEASPSLYLAILTLWTQEFPSASILQFPFCLP